MFVMFAGISEWDNDDGVLAHVIAQSQQEYLNSLKKSAGHLNKTNCTDVSNKGKSLMPKDGRH